MAEPLVDPKDIAIGVMKSLCAKLNVDVVQVAKDVLTQAGFGDAPVNDTLLLYPGVVKVDIGDLPHEGLTAQISFEKNGWVGTMQIVFMPNQAAKPAAKCPSMTTGFHHNGPHGPGCMCQPYTNADFTGKIHELKVWNKMLPKSTLNAIAGTSAQSLAHPVAVSFTFDFDDPNPKPMPDDVDWDDPQSTKVEDPGAGTNSDQ